MQDVAISLKELTLGSANQSFPAGWVDQCFAFQAPSSEDDKNHSTGCSFGLVQYKGGPCGILAVVQAYIIKVIYSYLFQRNFFLYDAVFTVKNAFLFCSIICLGEMFAKKLIVRHQKSSLIGNRWFNH